MKPAFQVAVVRFRVVGAYALLTHNPAGMSRGGDGTLTAKKIPSAEEEANRGLYHLPNGDYGIRVAAFRGALLRAAMDKSKIGKEFASTLVRGTVFAIDEFTTLVHPTTGKPLGRGDYAIDMRRVVQQRQGIIRARPRFDAWACEFDLEFDPSLMVPEVTLLPLMQKAGRRVGVGDYRPERGGPFGRFTAELVG